MSAPPIFILGITPHAGTNLLTRLLRLHPDCAAPGPITEDLFLLKARHLHGFVEKLWAGPGTWKAEPEGRARLWELLGSALVAFLLEYNGGKRLVTKSPVLNNVDLFFDLFPDAFLLILVRDGRAAVEGMVRGMDMAYERATQLWTAGARHLLDFARQGYKNADRYEIVRYEDLHLHCEATMRRLLNFLGLAVEAYDFAAARDLPVTGSSGFRGAGAEKKHWRPVPKTPEFRPLDQWRTWDAERLGAFRDAAGDLMTALGYPLEEAAAGPRPAFGQ